MVEPFAKRRSRAILTRAPKFYLFDVGVAGFLSGRRITATEGSEFGRAFEHFVLMEIIAARSYLERSWPIRYWRTKTGLEVDFVLGTAGDIAIEAKGGRIRSQDFKGIQAYVEEHQPTHAIVVSSEHEPRRVGEIDVLPWRVFLERLWAGELR